MIIAVFADLLILIAIIIIFRLYPVALVGGDVIWNRRLENSIALAKRFDTNVNKSEVFAQLIENEQKERLAEKLRINKNNVISEEKEFYKSDNPEYGKFINDYFNGNEKQFEQYVVAPQAFEALLKIKYNSDFGANNAAYNRAENFIARLNKGEAFEEVAKSGSDDKISGQLGGDLGFVTQNQILPELERALLNLNLGEVNKQITVSRLGYHILYPVQTSERDGQKVWHLKHILIQTQGFDTWLQSQLNTISVKKFTKP